MDVIQLKLEHFMQLQGYAQACLPEEACGFLLGKNHIVQQVTSIENSLHSSVKYLMNPRQQLDAMLWAEENGLEITGIFHSHPNGPATPSHSDIERFYYPGSAAVILSRSNAQWNYLAFRIEYGSYRKISLEVDSG